jgi:hypothetical protein
MFSDVLIPNRSSHAEKTSAPPELIFRGPDALHRIIVGPKQFLHAFPL